LKSYAFHSSITVLTWSSLIFSISELAGLFLGSPYFFYLLSQAIITLLFVIFFMAMNHKNVDLKRFIILLTSIMLVVVVINLSFSYLILLEPIRYYSARLFFAVPLFYLAGVPPYFIFKKLVND
jgi:hypothetical protein